MEKIETKILSAEQIQQPNYKFILNNCKIYIISIKKYKKNQFNESQYHKLN